MVDSSKVASELQWSPQQEEAMALISDWYAHSEDQVFYLAGYAGTGKTTLARAIIDKLGAGRVCVAAYTGKAAQVLRRKGFPQAGTIHGLIYVPVDRNKTKLQDLKQQLAVLEAQPEPREDKQIRVLTRQIHNEHTKLGQPAFTLNLDSDVLESRLVLIDECSMVDERIGEDLLSFGVKVLVLGDPGQLPPVKGVGYFTSCTPDYVLEEIHRQAAGNPIINMAWRVRTGENLAMGKYGHSRIMRRQSLTRHDEYQILLNADQILVGTNLTRFRINTMMRQRAQLKSPLPEKGDKLVCLRNNHDIGILNGSLWAVLKSHKVDESTVQLQLKADGEERTVDLVAHSQIFLDGRPIEWDRRIDGVEDFDYGYALTVHKSQGSQWRRVVLFDEWRFNERAKWLYTAITRAEEKIDILR